MSSPTIPTTPVQLSNEEVTSLIFNSALSKISEITGLNEQQAFALLSGQVNQKINDHSQLKKTNVCPPLLDHNEFTFIAKLFN